MRLCPSFFLMACVMASSMTQAKEFKDEDLGFRCVVPDQFESSIPETDLPENIFLLVEQKPAVENMPIHIQLVRMGPGHEGYHLKAVDAPKREGLLFSVEEFQWKGLTMSAIRTEFVPPSKAHLVNYSAIYPLDKREVELQVIGFVEREGEIRRIFYEVAAGFENLRPLSVKPERVETAGFFVSWAIAVGAAMLLAMVIAGVVVFGRR